MRRAVLLLVIALTGCAGRSEPLNIRRDAYKAYLSDSMVGTDEIVNKTLPRIRTGRTGRFSGRDELGNKVRVSVYVDSKNPMLLHVVATRNPVCPTCGGTGVRGTFAGLPLRCHDCEGTGHLKGVTNRKHHRVKAADLAAGEHQP